jgi:hypothetical protein
MCEPQQRRSDAEIVDEVLEVIGTPDNKREVIRAKVMEAIKDMRGFHDLRRLQPPPSQAQYKNQVQDYLKALRMVKRKSPAIKIWQQDEDREHQAFRAQLDAEIKRIEKHHDTIKTGPGHKPIDIYAEGVMRYALDLLCPDWPKDLPLPPLQRTRWPSTTPGKAWHRISTLLYEGVTGQPNSDKVLNYMGGLKRSKKYPW